MLEMLPLSQRVGKKVSGEGKRVGSCIVERVVMLTGVCVGC